MSPGDFGLASASRDELKGGSAEENAAILREVLEGREGPRRDAVLLNAAAALVAGDKADTMQQALPPAAAAVDSGAALGKLEGLVRVSQSLRPER